MTHEPWIAGGTVVVCFALLALGRIRPYLVMLGGLLVLLVTGVLDAKSGLAGFANSGLVTVAVLFVVAAGLRQTGTLAFLVRRALGRPRTARSAQARLALPVVLGSGFLNNTPVVAMLLPVIQDWCRASRIPPSKVLLPLSYFAIVGGLLTLIGTSTSLVVNGLLEARGYPSTGMFGITWVGLPCAVAGSLLLLALADRVLPDRSGASEPPQAPREYTVEMLVGEKGAVRDKTLEASGLLSQPGVALVEWARGTQTWERFDRQEVLRQGDRLVFVGVIDGVLDLFRIPGLSPFTKQLRRLDGHPTGRCYVEAVVSRTSPLLARTVREVAFLDLYGAVVLGVARAGQRVQAPLCEVDFRPGDALFLEAPRAFVDDRRNSGDFALIRRLDGEGPATSAQAPVAALILLAMVSVVAVGVLSMLEGALIAAGLMLLTRCCSEETARRSIDWPLLLTIGAAFGFGQALERTGIASMVAQTLLQLAGGDAWVSLIVVFGTTALLTEFVTNNAAAVIVLPIALETAQKLGVDHLPFVITVMVAASASFVTPVGYQTNLMVYTAGGYRFLDFARLGLPMTLLVGLITCGLAPLVYGF